MSRSAISQTEIGTSLPCSTSCHLRCLWLTWIAAGFLPLPALLTVDSASNAEVSILYLGLASAWLATEAMRFGGLPASRRAWSAKMAALCIAIFANAVIFIVLGLAAGVQSNLPFTLISALAVIPAIGLIPWLIQRIQQQYAAIILAGLIVFVAKLAGCVAARFAYGPDYMAQGYVSADWHTAKLMITIFWSITVLLSLVALISDYLCPVSSGRTAESICS
jgi:hypothetical protein